jgi:hypothetical protein
VLHGQLTDGLLQGLRWASGCLGQPSLGARRPYRPRPSRRLAALPAAVLWEGHTAVALGDLLTPESKVPGMTITAAKGIDNSGPIAADAFGVADGISGTYPLLLIPVR